MKRTRRRRPWTQPELRARAAGPRRRGPSARAARRGPTRPLWARAVPPGGQGGDGDDDEHAARHGGEPITTAPGRRNAVRAAALARVAATTPRLRSFVARRAGVSPTDGLGPGRAAHDRDEHPGADGPAAVGALALARGHRPRRGLDPRRARGHDRRHDREPADRGRLGDRADRVADRHRGGDLRRRRLPRRAVLRPPRRPDRAQEAVHAHARSSTSSPRSRRRSRARSCGSRSAASSPAPASAASTRRSTPRSTS